MAKIKVDGVWVTEENDIRTVVECAFKHLLLAIETWKPAGFDLGFERISLEEAEGLEAPFTEEEILQDYATLVGKRRLARMVFLWRFGSFLRSLSKGT